MMHFNEHKYSPIAQVVSQVKLQRDFLVKTLGR
jgi:hypothetical protein